MPRISASRFNQSVNTGPSIDKLPQRPRDYLEHGAPEGQRNNELFEAACQFRDEGFTQDDASGYLGPCAEKDGLPQAEIFATIRSAYARQAREPIHSGNGEVPPGSGHIPPPKKESPSGLPKPIPDGLKVLLETCFEEGEYVAISDTKLNADGEAKPGRGDVCSREVWLKRLEPNPIGQIYPKAREGLFIRINPIAKNGKADKDITALRHGLVECDLDQAGNRIPKEYQYAKLLESNLPISVVTDSGNKSIHGLVRLDAPNRAEYDRRMEIIREYFQKAGLPIDPQNKNPSRYSRCPGVERNLYDKDGKLIGTGRQELLAVRIGAATWEEWEQSQTEPDYTEEELRELTQEALRYYQFDDQKLPQPMAEEAYYGIAGKVVDIIAEQSEASREAILAQFLVGFGNIVGRNAYRKQSATHHLNEFCVLVGETSFGRKGTAWNAAEELFELIDLGWLSNRVIDGFQSGEAIIHEVRDARTLVTGKGKTVDPGVGDKRLLILEEEFGRFLSIASRQGNTISETTRKAWDGRKWLHTKGKISPEKATEAHVSLIGHVTKPELLKNIQEVENQNGFSNRILWLATYRAQVFPNPPGIDWNKNHRQLVDSLKEVLATFNGIRRSLIWSRDGEKSWDAFYRSLKPAHSGILGSITARSVAHVLRLTMLYTVLDNSTLMEPKHLDAAIAFWQYCVQSAEWIFGEKTGNKTADRIFWALQRAPKGMTREEIQHDVFSNHCSRITLDSALTVLIKADLVLISLERSGKAKKPRQRWRVKP